MLKSIQQYLSTIDEMLIKLFTNLAEEFDTSPKIVVLSSGEYAIRKGSHMTGYTYLDLDMIRHAGKMRWRGQGDTWWNDCKKSKSEEVFTIFNNNFVKANGKRKYDHGKPL